MIPLIGLGVSPLILSFFVLLYGAFWWHHNYTALVPGLTLEFWLAIFG